MRNVLIFCINLYQKIPFSSHKVCRFVPTCSEYAKEAILTYGTLRGSLLALKRLLRCRPGGSYGYDPVLKKENL